MIRTSLLGLVLGLSLAPSLAAADDDPPPANPKQVAEAYRKWTYTSCEHPSSCSSDIARAAGIRVYDPYMTNPRDNTPNPDPAWIPGWNKLPTGQQAANATDALVALHLAASRRTWLAACDARYAKVKPLLDARDAEAQRAIAAAAALPTYEKIPALLANPMRGRQGAKPFTPGDDSAAFAVEVAIVEAFKAIGREDVYMASDLGHTHLDVLPRWDAALEHDAFCQHALANGDPTAERGDAKALPALPTYNNDSRGAVAVRPVFATARIAELEAANGKRAAAAKAAFGSVSTGAPPRKEGNKPAAMESGPQLMGSPGEIKTFKLTGTKAVITLTHHADYNVGADYCINGYGLRVPCPTTRVVEDTTTTVTFADWPAGVTLAKGDHFTMFGREAKRTRKGSNTKVKWTVAVDGMFVVDVTRGGKLTSFLHPELADAADD